MGGQFGRLVGGLGGDAGVLREYQRVVWAFGQREVRPREKVPWYTLRSTGPRIRDDAGDPRVRGSTWLVVFWL